MANCVLRVVPRVVPRTSYLKNTFFHRKFLNPKGDHTFSDLNSLLSSRYAENFRKYLKRGRCKNRGWVEQIGRFDIRLPASDFRLPAATVVPTEGLCTSRTAISVHRPVQPSTSSPAPAGGSP